MSPSGDNWLSKFTEDWDEEERPKPQTAAAGHPGTSAPEDPSAVRLALDEHGLVQAVELEPTWRAQLTSRLLGAAVLNVANDLLATRFAESTDDAVTELSIDRLAAESAAATSSPGNWDELGAVLAAWSADFAAFKRQLAEAAAEVFVGAAPDDGVVATMRNGQFAEVTVDLRWVEFARHTEIGVELGRALRAAQQAAAAGGVANLSPPGSVAQVLRLARDPQALLRLAGMPG